MKVATWNVNSVNVRLPNVIKYLKDYQPDVLCLQELKCTEDKYPIASFEDEGYSSIQACQKTYNGVSIISNIKPKDIELNPVNISLDEVRSISATYGKVRVINFYVVNGQSIGSEKYKHKLKWLDKARIYINQQLKIYKDLMLVGDFNIVPKESDAHSFSAKDILCSDDERMALNSLVELGLNDCFQGEEGLSPYTWWDYRAGAFHRDVGYRIDLLLASNSLFKKVKSYSVHRETRHKSWCPDQPKTSDHAPVMVTF